MTSLDFSNVLTKTVVERLAEADEYEVVQEVQVSLILHDLSNLSQFYFQEYFADYAPLLPSLFSLNQTISAAQPFFGQSPNQWNHDALQQTVQGIVAVLLSLKKKPVIRYERMSSMAKKLGAEIQVRTNCAVAFK